MAHSAARLAGEDASSHTNDGDAAPATLTRRIQTLESTIWDNLTTENRQTCIAQLDRAWSGRAWLPPWPDAAGKTYSAEDLPSSDIFNLASITRLCIRNEISLPSLWKPGGVIYEMTGDSLETPTWTENLSVLAVVECGRRYGLKESQTTPIKFARPSPNPNNLLSTGNQGNPLQLRVNKTASARGPRIQEEETATSLYNKAMTQLQSGQSLSDDSIEFLQKLITKHVRSTQRQNGVDQSVLLDPLFLDITKPLPHPPQQIFRTTCRYIYAPLYHKYPGHWTLAKFDVQSARISWYDPLPQSDGARYHAVASALCPWLGGGLKPFKLEQLTRPLQTDSSSCGVYVLYMYYCQLSSLIVPFTLGHEEARTFVTQLATEAESRRRSDCTDTPPPIPTMNSQGSPKKRHRSQAPGVNENDDLEDTPKLGTQKRQRVEESASDLSPSNRFDPARAQAADIKVVTSEIIRLEGALSSFQGSYEDCFSATNSDIGILGSQLASAESNLRHLVTEKSQADEEIRTAQTALQALFAGNPTAARRYNTLRPMLETILPGGAVSEARDVLIQGDAEVQRIIDDVSRMAQAALNNVLGSQSSGPLHELEERVRVSEQRQKELSRSLKVSQQKVDELKAKLELETERKRLKDTLVRLITML